MKHSLKHYVSLNDATLVAAMLVALGLAWNTVSAMQRNYRLQQQYDQLKAEVELYGLENQNLRYTIAYQKTDDYLELAARDKFNKANPGETLVYLPTNGATKQAPVAKAVAKKSQQQNSGWRANVNSWWEFLRGRELS